MKKRHFIKELKQIELISKKHKKVCKILNYTEHLINLASTVTGYVSISAFASIVGIPVGIASSAATVKKCVIAAEIKKHKSLIKKKEHYEVILLDVIEVLISKVLINWNISHDGFFIISIELKEYDEMK